LLGAGRARAIARALRRDTDAGVRVVAVAACGDAIFVGVSQPFDARAIAAYLTLIARVGRTRSGLSAATGSGSRAVTCD
jgi:hypothetical protein